MSTCNKCGEPITFSYSNGRYIPIHSDGWCRYANSQLTDVETSSQKQYAINDNDSIAYSAFLNPNASCPVCGDHVFFYRCQNGGRVYFDDLGKPWEKHPCTTNKRKSSRHLTSTVTNKRKVIDYTSSIYKPFIIEKISYPDMEWILIQAKYNNYKIQVKFARKKALDANLRKVTFCMAAKQDNAYLVSYLNETGQADVIKGYCV